jgi:tRNA threonylcarbamoyl adenosine modification protein (Sua5/YciO/YrdC/YwlC family)
MRFDIFKDRNIIHCISDVSFNSIAGKARDRRAKKFLESCGYKISAKDIVWAEQVFGAKVHVCTIKDSGKTIKNVDGLISNIKNQILAVFSADCVPILIFDPENKVIATLHGSRKSLLKGIIKNAISKMVSKFSSDPKDILVGIGPHIRKCHYFMDLTKKTIDDFLKLGVKRKNIEDSKICTYCQANHYFSHRKRIDNPDFYKEKGGRFASFIGLSEDTNKIIRIKKPWQIYTHKKELIKAVNFIKQGKVLVCPTDTVYGLIADATNKKAVEKLFKIKERNLNKPVPIFVKDINAAKKLAFIDENQEKFLKKVWPGKVTVVLKRKNGLKLYGVDKETIGLRIPRHKFILSLLKIINKPLTGTSANISGEPASTKIEEVIKQFKGKKYQPDLIIDLGNLPKSRPSKVIDLTTQPPKVLRA